MQLRATAESPATFTTSSEGARIGAIHGRGTVAGTSFHPAVLGSARHRAIGHQILAKDTVPLASVRPPQLSWGRPKRAPDSGPTGSSDVLLRDGQQCEREGDRDISPRPLFPPLFGVSTAALLGLFAPAVGLGRVGAPDSSASRSLGLSCLMGAHVASCGRRVGPSAVVATGTVASAYARRVPASRRGFRKQNSTQ